MKKRADERKKWTSLDTFRLISEFESMPFLWNVYDDEYKNKRIKTKAIEKLAACFETSPREIHRKLHNLRCQYTSEVRKLRMRSSTAERHQSQWIYFDSFKFLSPVVNVRSSAGNDVIASISAYDTGRTESSSAIYGGDGYGEDDHEDASSSRDMKIDPLELEILRKRSDSESDFTDDKSKVASEMIKLDDFDIFGKLVVTHLRKMPLERAIRCQEKLFTLIMQERLADSGGSPSGKSEHEEPFTPYYESPLP